MDFPDHPFWDFSLRLHERPGVPRACLGLQRRYGLDVNLLFFGAGEAQGRSAVPGDVDAPLGLLVSGAFPEGEEEGVRKALALALGR